jgi:hypothetical protein
VYEYMGWLYLGQDRGVGVWAECIKIRIWVCVYEYIGWLNLV